MNHKYRHKAAFVAAVLFLQGACFLPSLVSAAGTVDTSKRKRLYAKQNRIY